MQPTSQRSPGQWQLVYCWMGVLGCLLMMLIMGCANKPEAKEYAVSEVPVAMMEDDPADPTALRLHDLAGKLLLYQATRHSIPTKLEDFASTHAGGDGLDPATGKAFVYTPDSSMRSGLPGRVILFQSTMDDQRGRWALIMNDLANDGRVVTYVQRVPEKLLPRVRSR